MNLNRDEMLARLATRRAELDGFGVRRLTLFGSIARGEARPDSDVDFLVEFEGASTFDRYMGLKLFLEDLLERKVDLVTERSINPALRSHIEAESLHAA